MALNKEDLSQIKEVVHTEMESAVDNFAGVVNKSFNRVERKLEEHGASLQHLDERMDHLDARIGRMEADIHEIKGNIVYKYEFEDLSARVKLIETKLGIESGK